MTEHTPGPWRVNPLVYMRVNAANSNVARISREHGDIEGEANARLIAAAPDLLAACEVALDAMLAHDFGTLSLCPQLRAAIAKARGGNE